MFSFFRKLLNHDGNVSTAPVIVVAFLFVAGTVTFLGMEENTPEKRLTQVSSVEFAETVIAEDDITLIDVRTAKEYSTGHLPGAINIDYRADSFKNTISDLEPTSRYAIYCRSGNRSRDVLNVMREKGFIWVIDLSGGIEALSANTEAMGSFGY